MVANADPKEVASTVEKLKEVEKELVKVEQASFVSTSTSATPTAKVENQVSTTFKVESPELIQQFYTKNWND